jgi:large subunit ribosomal protein L29
MKALKAAELRNKSIEDLEDELEKEREALYNVRRQIIFGQLKDVMTVRTHRRNVARVLTILQQKRKEAEE